MKKIKRKIVKFLLWTQKWTKTDMLYLAKGGFWMSTGQGIVAISGFFLSIAFANLLNPKTFGNFNYINSFIGMLSILSMGGISTALTRSVAKGYEATVGLALKSRLTWGILSGIAGLITAVYYYINENFILTISFIIIAAFVPFLRPLGVWKSYLSGRKKFKELNRYKSIGTITYTAIFILTLFFINNLFLLIAINLALMTLKEFIFLNITLKKYPPNNKTDSEAIKLGKHLSVMSALSPVSKKFDIILLFHYLGPEEVAIYNFAKIPANKFRQLFFSMKSLAFPKIAKQKIENIKKTIYPKLLKSFFIMLAFYILYLLLIPSFFNLLMPQYKNSIIYSMVLGAEILFLPSMLLGQVLINHAKKRHLYFIKIFYPATHIILILLLLPLYKIWGTIFALFGARILTFLIYNFIFKKTTSSLYL